MTYTQKITTLMTALLLGGSLAYGQTDKDTSNAAIQRTADDLKTGNTLDVLTNFFQLAVQDIGGKDHSFQFASTLFGIKVKADSNLLIDNNFRMHRFDRNFQFALGLKANEDFKFTGYSAGITYAIVNNRDKKQADFTKRFHNKMMESQARMLREMHQNNAAAQHDAEESYWADSASGGGLSGEDKIKAQNQIVAFWQAYDQDGTIGDLPAGLMDYYKAKNDVFMREAFNKTYNDLMDGIAKRGLLTVSLNAKTDTFNSIFNEAHLEFVYLKGGDFQADIRSGIDYKDTLTPNQNNNRFIYHANAGLNIILLRSKRSKKSLVEFKPNLEFRSILSKKYPGQENYFSCNADLRIRITQEIWLPLVLKYDVNKGNFLGYINVSVNLAAFKNAFKSQ